MIVPTKRQSVFFLGFLIGFGVVFIIKYRECIVRFSNLNEKTSTTLWVPHSELLKSSKSYKLWFQEQEMKVSEVDEDVLIYGNLLNKKKILEAEWLKEKVPIICVVFIEKLKFASAIRDTWAKRCNNVFLFSQHLANEDLSVINLGIKYTSSWQYLCEVVSYIWRNKEALPLKWIIFVKEDSIVIPGNLRHMLAPLDFREPIYLGHTVVLWGQSYNVAEAGYVLSYESFRRIAEKFDSHKKCATSGRFWKKEDYYLGKHLQSLKVYPSDTRDAKKHGTFNGFSLISLLWGSAKPHNYYTRAVYPSSGCCSEQIVTFNIAEADKLRTVDYFLNHMRVFQTGSNGNKPAATAVPEEEVWKSALREEFNLTGLEEISSEKYFQIWKSKYSEPELFIRKNLRVTADEREKNVCAEVYSVTRLSLAEE